MSSRNQQIKFHVFNDVQQRQLKITENISQMC